MFKRIAAAVAVIILASLFVAFSARELPSSVKNENSVRIEILQENK